MTIIRRFELDDLDFADRQKEREGWAISREQFMLFLRHDPDGCFVATVDDQPVGMVTSICFGPSGWIGNLIVEPEFRSSGIGRALMEHAIETLKVKGGTTVRLEADPPGIPLYRKLGFVDEFESCRLKLAASKQRPPVDRKAAEPMTTDDLHAVASLDNEIVGPDRRRYLELKFAAAEFAIVRRQGRRIVASLMAAAGRPVLIGLPAVNTEGLAMLAELGFEKGESSFRMRLGPPIDAGDPTRVFAIASGAVG
jgi:GNAT superfamily N-acetyltransferase